MGAARTAQHARERLGILRRRCVRHNWMARSSSWRDRVHSHGCRLTPFPPHLPLIILGRDVTDLLKSYHPFSDKPQAILQKRRVGVLSTYELNRFAPDTGFYRELRQEVGEYFKRTGFHPKDPMPGMIRLAALFLTMLVTFVLLNSVQIVPSVIRYSSCIVFGVCQALILLHMMHDASHSSIGYNETWWNVVGRFTMDWVCGSSITSWHHQHVLGHHIYTNIMGTDPDLPASLSGDLRYIVPRQVHQFVYSFQWIYMPVLYGLLSIKFRIQDLTYTFGSEVNGAIRVNPLGPADWAQMIGAKAFHIVQRIIVPYMVFGLSPSDILINYITLELATGYFLAFNFQVSHVSTEAAFPLGDREYKTDIDQEWAVVQVITGVDYAHDNAIMSFLCGHLNYQIEHHLLPSVSQYHYPAIAPIVRKVCEKWKIPYNYLPTFTEAIYLHVKYLYNMGVHQKQGKGDSLWH